MTPELAAVSQSLTPGTLIELYVLDLTPIGVATTYYLTPSNQPGYTISFDGHAYTYAPITLTGIERSVNGDPPNPKVFLPNVDKFAAALVSQHDDLVGAQVTRMRTYKDFLDGEPLEDGSAYMSRDLYTIEQKLNLNHTYGEFALRPLYALDGKFLPKRVCLKEVCTHRYRIFDPVTGEFDVTHATCPYAGTVFFTQSGEPTLDPSLDACGKALNDCAIRFGATEELPMQAFPGMSRTRLM